MRVSSWIGAFAIVAYAGVTRAQLPLVPSTTTPQPQPQDVKVSKTDFDSYTKSVKTELSTLQDAVKALQTELKTVTASVSQQLTAHDAILLDVIARDDKAASQMSDAILRHHPEALARVLASNPASLKVLRDALKTTGSH
jgi:hypothetical protein